MPKVSGAVTSIQFLKTAIRVPVPHIMIPIDARILIARCIQVKGHVMTTFEYIDVATDHPTDILIPEQQLS